MSQNRPNRTRATGNRWGNTKDVLRLLIVASKDVCTWVLTNCDAVRLGPLSCSALLTNVALEQLEDGAPRQLSPHSPQCLQFDQLKSPRRSAELKITNRSVMLPSSHRVPKSISKTIVCDYRTLNCSEHWWIAIHCTWPWPTTYLTAAAGSDRARPRQVSPPPNLTCAFHLNRNQLKRSSKPTTFIPL